MGGMYHPTAKGIMYGRIAGLNNSVTIVEYILKVGKESIRLPEYYTLPGIEFYIGFGAGYTQGQELRLRLKNDLSSQLPLKQKIECLSFLLEKQEICKQNLMQSFLDNIHNWGEFKIPVIITKEIEFLLENNKVQRAVDRLFIFYKDNFHLKSLKEFYRIYKNLIDIRKEKKKNKNFNVLAALDKIRIETQNWLFDRKKD